MNKEEKSREIKEKEVNLIKISQIVGLLFIIVFLAACKKESPFAPIYTLKIEGVVSDVTTSAPIAGATAEFWLSENFYRATEAKLLIEELTDGNGYYYIEYTEAGTVASNCYEGEFQMRASASGYEKLSLSFVEWKRVSCTEKVQRIDIQLTPKD